MRLDERGRAEKMLAGCKFVETIIFLFQFLQFQQVKKAENCVPCWALKPAGIRFRFQYDAETEMQRFVVFPFPGRFFTTKNRKLSSDFNVVQFNYDSFGWAKKYAS